MRQRKAQSEWEQNRPKTKMELEQEHHQKIEEQRLLEEKEKVFFFFWNFSFKLFIPLTLFWLTLFQV